MAVIAQDAFGVKAIRGKVVAAQIHLWYEGRLIAAKDYDNKAFPPQVNNMAEWFRRSFIQLKAKDIIDQLRKWGKDWEWKAEMLINEGEGPKHGRGCRLNTFTCKIPTDQGLYQVVVHIHAESYQQRYQKMRRDNPDYIPRTQVTDPTYALGQETNENGPMLRSASKVNKDGLMDYTANGLVLDPQTGMYYDPRLGKPNL